MKLDTRQTLSAHVTQLLESKKNTSRINLAREMNVADGTLGRIKYGTGNPTIDVLDNIAAYFNMETWELLKPPGAEPEGRRRRLSRTASEPKAGERLGERIVHAADRGQLDDSDLQLIEQLVTHLLQLRQR